MQTITSRRHPLVAACRDARHGGDGQPLLLDGWHLVSEAADAGVAVDAVAVGPGARDATATAMLDRLEGAGAHVVRVTADVLTAMSPVRTPSGIVALARRPPTAMERVFSPTPALVLTLIDVQDPGNVGALVRTAEAAGATGLLAAGSSADPFGWKALRAAMGSAFRLPLARVADPADVLRETHARGGRVVALVPRDGTDITHADLSGPLCLLLGSEGQGLAADLAALADARVRVPMRAPVESLNVAVAGALALYAASARRSAAL
jgi:TrmH family RNA methyltransferase